MIRLSIALQPTLNQSNWSISLTFFIKQRFFDTLMDMRAKRLALPIAIVIAVASLQPAQANVTDFNSKTSIANAKTMIRKLIYNYSQNCANSFNQCVSFTLANNYPGYLDKKIALSCSKLMMPQTLSASVDLNSISPDSGWRTQPPYYQDENPALRGAKLKGDIFIGTVTLNYLFADGTSRSTTSDRHFSILNKRAYFFNYLCSY